MKDQKILPESIAGAIFSPDRTQILLIKRRDVPVWVLPGGGIDPGETPEAATLREMEEETGLEVKIERLVGDYRPINRLTKPTYLYECSMQHGSLSLSAETRAVAFFSLHSLPAMPPPYPEWVEDATCIGPTIQRNLTSVNYLALCKGFFLYPSLVLRFLLSRMGFPINSK